MIIICKINLNTYLLYHGTNADIAEIDLMKCAPNKDFGRGFYLTDIGKQAEYMAMRRVKQSGVGKPVVIEYFFDEHLLQDKSLRVRRFNKPSEAWARFALENRTGNNPHDYDIVMGPVADDGVALQLRRYTENLISMRTLIGELTNKKLNNQYCFCTPMAVSKLKKL